MQEMFDVNSLTVNRKMETFILKVRSYPILWNSNDTFYRDVSKKNAVWEFLASECGMVNGKEAKMTWKKLRCSHREAMRRRQTDKTLAPWKYEQQMDFILALKNNDILDDDIDNTELSTFVEVKDFKTSDDENCVVIEDNPLRYAEEVHNASANIKRSARDCNRMDIRNDVFDSNRSNLESFDDDEALRNLFSSLYQKTRSLPKLLQLRVQREVFTAVNRAEEEALNFEYRTT